MPKIRWDELPQRLRDHLFEQAKARKITKEDLIVLKELIEAGKLTPVIDRTYPLSETPAAMRYLEQGHSRGKVVLTV